MIKNKLTWAVLLFLIVSYGCVLSSNSEVKKEQEPATPINDVQVLCANNAQSIEELKMENAKIKGEIERQDHTIKKLEESIASIQESSKKVNIEADAKEAAVPEAAASSTSGTETATAAIPAPATVPQEKMDIDEKYKMARNAHEQKKYEEAEKLYTSMVGTKSLWFDERARFFLGKMYAESGQHKKAIITFQEFIDKYPQSKNIANATYAQAESFLALGQKKEAAVFLKDLVARFPKTKEAALARKKLKGI